MATYEVHGHATVICGMRVEANSEEEAIKIANEEFGSLTNYVGMGGTGCLLGVPTGEDDRCVFPDSEVEHGEMTGTPALIRYWRKKNGQINSTK